MRPLSKSQVESWEYFGNVWGHTFPHTSIFRTVWNMLKKNRLSRENTVFLYYARRDSNPQPSVPKSVRKTLSASSPSPTFYGTWAKYASIFQREKPASLGVLREYLMSQFLTHRSFNVTKLFSSMRLVVWLVEINIVHRQFFAGMRVRVRRF